MGTSFDVVYNRFLGKITDYSFIKLDVDELSKVFYEYLISAIVRFKNCKQDLSNRDEEEEKFNVNLTDEEVEILGTLMVVAWLDPLIQATNLLKQIFSPREQNFYSQSKHLEELMKLRKEAKREAQQLMIAYSYKDKISELK